MNVMQDVLVALSLRVRACVCAHSGRVAGFAKAATRLDGWMDEWMDEWMKG